MLRSWSQVWRPGMRKGAKTTENRESRHTKGAFLLFTEKINPKCRTTPDEYLFTLAQIDAVRLLSCGAAESLMWNSPGAPGCGPQPGQAGGRTSTRQSIQRHRGCTCVHGPQIRKATPPPGHPPGARKSVRQRLRVLPH